MFFSLILYKEGKRRKRAQEIEAPLVLEKCPGQNTNRIPIGTCECKSGYPFGDPNDEKGCWRCADKCALNAECVYPGICTCPEGYFGDGKTKCELITPKIISYYPRQGTSDTIVNISYTYENSSKFTSAFCKFGSIPVSTTEFTSSYMLCKAPTRKPEIVSLSISFDTVQWSKEDATFIYVDKPDPVSFLPFLILSLIVTLAGVVSAGKIGNYITKKNDDEKRPFILGNQKKKGRTPYEQIKKRHIDSI